MATDSEHLKGIALQAERVVAAYKAMRAAAAKDKGGEFPVDEIGKLFSEVGALENWIDPHAMATANDTEPVEVIEDKSAADIQSGAETFSEHIKRQLGDVKNILSEIALLAHEGQESRDAALVLSAIERLTGGAVNVLYGELWDKLCDGLRLADGGAE